MIPARFYRFGHVEGKNILLSTGMQVGSSSTPVALAAELVRLKVDVIVTTYCARRRGRQECDRHDPHRYGDSRRSGRHGACHKPGATERKHHGS